MEVNIRNVWGCCGWGWCYWRLVGRGQGYYSTPHTVCRTAAAAKIILSKMSIVLRLRNHALREVNIGFPFFRIIYLLLVQRTKGYVLLGMVQGMGVEPGIDGVG